MIYHRRNIFFSSLFEKYRLATVAFLTGLLLFFSIPAFLFSQNIMAPEQVSPIEKSILEDSQSFYYINFKRYHPDASLPIGIFDSGTGGLAILNVILNYDKHNNSTLQAGGDGMADFTREKFIFLADQANMPYGNYYSEHKTDLLIEHVLKDAQFLLSNKYYLNDSANKFKEDKEPVKSIVIACNTATAYAKEHIEEFIAKSGINLKIIGVIDAGAKGVLSALKKNENGSIGVLATVGTIASKGYERTINIMKDSLKYSGQLEIFNQGGYGLAESIDGIPDFINTTLSKPRNDYRGPKLDRGEFAIDRTLLSIYNFDFSRNKMLCDSKIVDDCNILQINSPDNYLRYHLVSLMEQIRKAKNAPQLKAIVLGCTHYPYLVKEIRQILNDLYRYKKNGKYVYRPMMAENIRIIDPAENVATELFEYLRENKLFNSHVASSPKSEFYITVPSLTNANTRLSEHGGFTYEYKYGRKAGEIQEYVKTVPFSKNNIPPETIERLKRLTPALFQQIKVFEKSSTKMAEIPPAEKITN